jgi:hypothetical protein
VSITKHSGYAMARSLMMGDNMPLRIQSRIDTPTKMLGNTTSNYVIMLGALPRAIIGV